MNNLKPENIFSLLASSVFFIKIIKTCFKQIEKNVRVNKIGSPCISYDIKLESINNSRELLVSLTNYGKVNRLSVYIYNLEKESSSTFDLGRFLKEECQDESTYNLMTFQAKTIQEIEKKTVLFFQTLDAIHLNKITKILNGEDWFDMPFDWHGYK